MPQLETIQLRGLNKILAMIKMFACKEFRSLPIGVQLALNYVSKTGKMTRHNGRIYLNSFSPPFPGRSFAQFLASMKELRNGKGVPFYTDIAVTQKCLYNCWHCSYKKRKAEKDLEIDVLKRLTHDLQDLGACIIGITGGEPLLREDLPEIIGSIDDRTTVLLFTTGYGLTPQLADCLKEAGLTIPIISLDHYRKEVHDELRGFKGAFERAVDAIKIFKKKGFYVCLTMAPPKDVISTREEVEKYLDFVKGLGVHEVRLATPSLSGNLLGKMEARFEDYQFKLLNEISLYYNKKTDYPTVSSFALVESKEQFGCGAGFHFCFIDHMGNVCPCDVSPLSFGNIREKEFKIIFEEMNGYFHCPRSTCYANAVSEQVNQAFEGFLPLPEKAAKKIVTEYPPASYKYELPKFYEIAGIRRQKDIVCQKAANT